MSEVKGQIRIYLSAAANMEFYLINLLNLYLQTLWSRKKKQFSFWYFPWNIWTKEFSFILFFLCFYFEVHLNCAFIWSDRFHQEGSLFFGKTELFNLFLWHICTEKPDMKLSLGSFFSFVEMILQKSFCFCFQTHEIIQLLSFNA